MLSRLLLAATLLLTAGVGCSNPSYVNIPPQRGDLALHNPNTLNVRQVVASAVAGAMELEPVDGAFVVVLPEGSTQATYTDIVRRVGGGAIAPDTFVDGPVPAVHVASVRIRNREAEVDLLRPSPSGRQVTTVYLRWYYGGEWAVMKVRPWRASLGEPLPTFGGPTESSEGTESGVAEEPAMSEERTR